MIEKFIKGKVAVFIDAANIESSVRAEGFRLYHRQLARYIKKHCNLIYLGYYTVGFQSKNHQNFLKFLRRTHFTVKTKPLKIIRDIQGKSVTEINKANFDVEIAVDSMDLKSNFDTMFLFSGDSDFDYLVKRIRKDQKTVIVVSLRGHISLELIKSANKYIPLTKFPKVLKKSSINKKSPPTSGGK